MEALAGFRAAASPQGVSVGVLLSDGVPSEDMLDYDNVSTGATPKRDKILATLRHLRREFGPKCVLHTVGLGSFNFECLRSLAKEGGGQFFGNSQLNSNILRSTFRRLFATVSMLRGTLLAFGANALRPLPKKELEPINAWQQAQGDESNVRQKHQAWVMLPSRDSPHGDLHAQEPPNEALKHRKPFAEGSLRYASHLFIKFPDREMHLVVKEGKFATELRTPQAVAKNFLANHHRAQQLAGEFRRAYAASGSNPPGRAGKFVPAFVIQIRSSCPVLGPPQFVTAERFIAGEFIKINGNDGYVNESVDREVAEVAAAFSHFTFEHTRGQQLCVDIQGVGLEWTDPQLHSVDKAFGPADLGREGMKMFFTSHVCSARCTALGLHRVHAESLAIDYAQHR